MSKNDYGYLQEALDKVRKDKTLSKAQIEAVEKVAGVFARFEPYDGKTYQQGTLMGQDAIRFLLQVTTNNLFARIILNDLETVDEGVALLNDVVSVVIEGLE